MHLLFKGDYQISDIRDGDEPAFVEHMREREIYERTLNIPFPYTEKDARDWVALNVEKARALNGETFAWAIRRADGYLIGGIGFQELLIGKSHRAELGYWLAKPYWGKGIVSSAVQAAVRVGFERFGLARITANVFVDNIASARVLEKAGFQLEGVLRKHYKKDGVLHDGKLYALLSE